MSKKSFTSHKRVAEQKSASKRELMAIIALLTTVEKQISQHEGKKETTKFSLRSSQRDGIKIMMKNRVLFIIRVIQVRNSSKESKKGTHDEAGPGKIGKTCTPSMPGRVWDSGSRLCTSNCSAVTPKDLWYCNSFSHASFIQSGLKTALMTSPDTASSIHRPT